MLIALGAHQVGAHASSAPSFTIVETSARKGDGFPPATSPRTGTRWATAPGRWAPNGHTPAAIDPGGHSPFSRLPR